MDSIAERLSTIFNSLREKIGDDGSPRKKKWYAYGALLLLSVILFFTIGSKSKYAELSTRDVAEVGSGEVFREMSERLAIIESGRAYSSREMAEEVIPVYSSWGRDPFASGEGEISRSAPESDLLLTAISWRANEAVVLINDSVLRRGDSINGAEVVWISPGSVILGRGSGQIILSLEGGADVE